MRAENLKPQRLKTINCQRGVGGRRVCAGRAGITCALGSKTIRKQNGSGLLNGLTPPPSTSGRGVWVQIVPEQIITPSGFVHVIYIMW